MNDFVHLHVHTRFSLGESINSAFRLIKKLKDFGMTAYAITEKNNFFSIPEFYHRAKRQELKPIIGCEFTITNKTRKNRRFEEQYQLVLLAQNKEGFKNLCYLCNMAWSGGMKKPPVLEKKLLKNRSEGIICISSAEKGEISEAIKKNDIKTAITLSEEYKKLFNPDNFYLELVDNGLPYQKELNNKLFDLSEQLNIQIVATNNCHYLEKEDHAECNLWRQIAREQTKSDIKELENGDYSFKSAEEMHEIFKDYPAALHNTIKIAERCNFSFEPLTLHGYNFQGHDRGKQNKLLREKVFESFCNLLEKPPVTYKGRIEKELQIICENNYSPHFLVAHDIVNFAKNNQIEIGPGKWAIPASLVCYCLGITEIDPIKHHLIFERSFNCQAMFQPEIVIDIEEDKITKVKEFLKKHFGDEKVTTLINFKSADLKVIFRVVIDFFRKEIFDKNHLTALKTKEEEETETALNFLLQRNNRELKYLMNPGFFEFTKMAKMDNFRETSRKNPVLQKLIIMVYRLDCNALNFDENFYITEFYENPATTEIPVIKDINSNCYSYFSSTDMCVPGAIKLNLLRSKPLNIIGAITEILSRKGVHLIWNQIDEADPMTFKLLNEGNPSGIYFQISVTEYQESKKYHNFIKKISPMNLNQLTACDALYRDGPINQGMHKKYKKFKKNPERVTYVNKCLRDILEETFGMLLFQEQLMEIIIKVTGKDPLYANYIRNNACKKRLEVMEGEKENIIKFSAEANGFSRGTALEIYDFITTYAEYTFQKSHAIGSAMVLFRTLYLQAHYPEEYSMAINSLKKIKHNQQAGII